MINAKLRWLYNEHCYSSSICRPRYNITSLISVGWGKFPGSQATMKSLWKALQTPPPIAAPDQPWWTPLKCSSICPQQALGPYLLPAVYRQCSKDSRKLPCPEPWGEGFGNEGSTCFHRINPRFMCQDDRHTPSWHRRQGHLWGEIWG